MSRFVTSSAKSLTSFFNNHRARMNAPSTSSAQCRNNRLLYGAATFACLSALAIQALPEEGSFVRQRFNTNANYSKHDGALANTKKIARWAFILFGTGFAGMFSSKDASFQTIANFVEFYMQYNFHTVFTENLAPDGKRYVFFRGETTLEAEKVLQNNRSPLFWSLISGEIGLPTVTDPILDPQKQLPSGYTRGVISLTTDLNITQNFGQGEAVLVVVPTKQRVAAVSQHCVKGDEGGEHEYMCGGVHKRDILGVAYRNLETQEFNRFVLNPNFKGEAHKLKMDEQMRPLINLLPDTEPKKSILLNGIDSTLRAQDHYESLLAANQAEHRAQLPKRTEKIATHGFNGNGFLQTAFTIHNNIQKVATELTDSSPRPF